MLLLSTVLLPQSIGKKQKLFAFGRFPSAYYVSCITYQVLRTDVFWWKQVSTRSAGDSRAVQASAGKDKFRTADNVDVAGKWMNESSSLSSSNYLFFPFGHRASFWCFELRAPGGVLEATKWLTNGFYQHNTSTVYHC